VEGAAGADLELRGGLGADDVGAGPGRGAIDVEGVAVAEVADAGAADRQGAAGGDHRLAGVGEVAEARPVAGPVEGAVDGQGAGAADRAVVGKGQRAARRDGGRTGEAGRAAAADAGGPGAGEGRARPEQVRPAGEVD